MPWRASLLTKCRFVLTRRWWPSVPMAAEWSSKVNRLTEGRQLRSNKDGKNSSTRWRADRLRGAAVFMWSFAGCNMYVEIVTAITVTCLFLQQEKKMFTLTETHFHRVREKHQWGKCHGKPKSYPRLQKHQTKINEKALQNQWQRQYLSMRIGLLRQICKRQHWQINTTNRVFLIDNIRLWHFTNQPLLGEINAYETWLRNATWGGRCHASPTTADLSVCPQRSAVACSFPVSNVPTAKRLIRRRGLISSPGLAIKSTGRLVVRHAVGIHQRSHSHASEYNNYTAAH